jgi:hypothetical protein
MEVAERARSGAGSQEPLGYSAHAAMQAHSSNAKKT